MRVIPPELQDERRMIWAIYLIILRYVHEVGINNTILAPELMQCVTEYALELGLEGADLLDPENTSFKEIARDSLVALRVPNPTAGPPY